jgi:tetratricopeptide (TPR) repeat protein
MTDPAPRSSAAQAIHLDELDRIPLEHGVWRPVRRPFGITAFGVNAYSADGDGDSLIEPHDEAGAGAGRHEELYLVATGAATFTVGDERIDAPAGTLVFVPPGVHREAVAAAEDTTVFVIGGRPGAGLPVSPFEYWYAANPAYEAGDWQRAIEILSEGLNEWPDHPRIHYILACFHARAGERDKALHHLNVAAERDEVALEYAATEPDFDGLRDDPDFPAKR